MEEINFGDGEIKEKRLLIELIEPGLVARLHFKLQEEKKPIKIVVPRDLIGAFQVELGNYSSLNLELNLEKHTQHNDQIPAVIGYKTTKFDPNNGGLSSPIGKPHAKNFPYGIPRSRRASR